MANGQSDNLKTSHYFLGVDTAPAQSSRADDGALVVLKAFPRAGLGEQPGMSPSDWTAAFVYAYRVRGETAREMDEGVKRAQTARHWSGLVHGLHRRFGFSGIMLDPGGGGQWVMAELNKGKQMLDGIETACRPIATMDDRTVGEADYCLCLLRRRDPGVASLWPMLAGDDNLVDAMHTAMQQGLETGGLVFPRAFNDRPREETAAWPVELQWALKNLDAVRHQLQNMEIAMKDDGVTYDITRNGARKFFSSGKKDLAYAAIMAYVRFLVWLKMGEWMMQGQEDEAYFNMV